jgi:GTPase Era involved in 16S rRNA processing
VPIKIGLIGKTNTGKTTFFNAATLSEKQTLVKPLSLTQQLYLLKKFHLIHSLQKNQYLEYLMPLRFVFILNSK